MLLALGRRTPPDPATNPALPAGRVTAVVCLTNDTESACMYSCGATPEKRTADLTDLLYQNGSTWDQDTECKGESVTGARRTGLQTSAEGGGGAELMSLLLSVRGGLPPTLGLEIDSGSPDSPGKSSWTGEAYRLTVSIGFPCLRGLSPFAAWWLHLVVC